MQDLQSNEIIFGDSLSDLEAAKYYDINFILVKTGIILSYKKII